MKIPAFCILLLLLFGACGRRDASQERTALDSPVPDPWKAESIAYRYWGSPASPYRDEGRYIQFLDSLLASDSLPEGLRERAQYKRRIAALNRPGTIAADFRFLERQGAKSRLHNLKSPYTLLIFYDPECPHCSDILRSISSSRTVNRAIAEKELTVIAVYAEGKREVWDTTFNDMPDNWLVGFDLTGILDEEMYDLPAMPTPYLLDSDKRVMMKDPGVKPLLSRIAELIEFRNTPATATRN